MVKIIKNFKDLSNEKNTCFVMLAALMMAGCNNEIDEQVMDSRRVPLQIMVISIC